MSENEHTTTSTETTTAEQPEPQGEGTDWKAEARKWEKRAKENADAARRLSEIEGANKTAEQRIADLEKRVAEADAKDRRAALVSKVAQATGVSPQIVSMLSANDEEGLTAQANSVAGMAKVPTSNVVRTDNGGPDGTLGPIPTEQIKQLKSQHDRIMAYAQQYEQMKQLH